MSDRVDDEAEGAPLASDRFVLKPGRERLDGRPRCLKRRLVPCEEEAVERLADRYRRHLVRALGDRGDEVALAIREELMNYLEHSARFDASRRLQVTSCRIGTHLVFFWGMETDTTFDPNLKRSGRHRGHGLNIIGSFADVHVVDHLTEAPTGTGSTTIFDLSRHE